MRRSRRSMIDDEGSAALEFVTVGVILLVPLLYVVISLGMVQEQTLGAEAAAREAARVISLAPDADAAAARADAVLEGIIDEYGMDAESIDLAVTCAPSDAACPTAGATVIVTVATRVRLPLVPGIFGLDRAAAVPIEAQTMQKISRQWGAE